MRTEYCLTHVVGDIEKFIAKGCLSEEVAEELIKDAAFRKAHPKLDISSITTTALRPLRRESDLKTQAKAISLVEKHLNKKTPTGGKINKSVTAEKVEKILTEARHPKSFTAEEKAEMDKHTIHETPKEAAKRCEDWNQTARDTVNEHLDAVVGFLRLDDTDERIVSLRKEIAGREVITAK